MQSVNAIEFVRGLCLPLMMLEQLRHLWLAEVTHQPLGFFSAAVVFIFLSGYMAGMRTPSQPLKRWLQLYALHMSLSLVVISLAGNTFLGREIEIAITNPWRALLDAALLMPRVPLLDFLPMYLVFLAFTPLLLASFEAGREKLVFAVSFGVWLGAQCDVLPDLAGWQLLYVIALYLGATPLELPAKTKALNLGLFGCLVALAMLRHADWFGLESFRAAMPAWWVEQASLGPMVLLNLALWVAFLWLVPEPLTRMSRQGRLFIAMGHNAFAMVAWEVLLFYAFMSWFPQLYQYSATGQALVACFAVACLVFPVAFGINAFLPEALSSRRSDS
jgi:hypothetical protein